MGLRRIEEENKGLKEGLILVGRDRGEICVFIEGSAKGVETFPDR